MPETEEENSIASVDVGVALFAAVLAIFAMIEFVAPTVEPQPELPTIGLVEETLSAIPSSWAAVQPRTVMTLVHEEELTVLDMGHIAAAASDLNLRLINHPTANMRFNDGRGTDPVKTELTLTFDINDVPKPWIRWHAALDGGVTCDELTAGLSTRAGGMVTLIVTAAPETNVATSLGLMSACELPFRTIMLPAPEIDGRVVLTLGLSRALFAMEMMLR